MRRRSIAGPIILLAIGAALLWNNLRPDVAWWRMAAQWWPCVLILWGLIRLAEVTVWPERRTAHTVGGGEIVLIVLICIAGSLIHEGHNFPFRFHTRGIEVFGEQFDYPVNAQASGASIQRVVFENQRGNIRVTGGDAPQVSVTGHKTIRAYNRKDADATDRNTPVEVVTQGDRLLVRTNQERTSGEQTISADLEVTVPRGVAIDMRGRSGDYEISDISGDVDISSDNAGVRLARIGGGARVNLRRSDIIRAADIKGAVTLEGRGTDIELENIAGQVTINGAYSGALSFKKLAKPLLFESRNTELRAEGVPGKIDMNLSQFTASDLVGPVRFVTKARDIRIEGFTQSLDLETDRGDIELVPRLPMPKIEARSRAGNIELKVPEKAAFQLQAVAERGDTVNDFGPAIEKQTEGRTASLKGKVGNGPLVHLTTDGGTVTVRKAGPGKPQSLDEAKF